jgi:histidyl-tRNA synthetase
VSKSIQAIRGMNDILPVETPRWQYVENVFRDLMAAYGYSEIRLPSVEKTELFKRSIGEVTDIVEKEMYTFLDKSRNSITLRPEFTAGVARAYIEHGMHTLPQPVKLFYWGPVFRYDRPQAGRFREFYQFGMEIFGEGEPIIDAQLITLVWDIYQKLKLKNISLQINSIGCPTCRENYKKELVDYYIMLRGKLCDDCKRRLKKNPLRLLDCKNETCLELGTNAPQIVDYLCNDCHNHFQAVLEYLDEVSIPYQLNPKLVRGFDYYNRTTFEIWGEKEGAQNALGGGGRYDGLVKLLGGRETPAVGFSGGCERIIEAMQTQEVKIPAEGNVPVFIVQLGEQGRKQGLRLAEELRNKNIGVADALGKSSLKAQMKLADKRGAQVAIIIGQREAIKGTVILRNMAEGIQNEVPFEKAVEKIRKVLK